MNPETRGVKLTEEQDAKRSERIDGAAQPLPIALRRPTPELSRPAAGRRLGASVAEKHPGGAPMRVRLERIVRPEGGRTAGAKEQLSESRGKRAQPEHAARNARWGESPTVSQLLRVKSGATRARSGKNRSTRTAKPPTTKSPATSTSEIARIQAERMLLEA